MTYDVIVVGLGAMGSAAAYHLALRKKRVLGIEQFGPAHSLGSSHGDSRIIRQAYHEHPDYVPLLLRSYELWRQLERDSEKELLVETGGLMIGPPGSTIVSGALLSARLHNLNHQALSSAEVRRRFPALHLRPDDEAVFEPNAGYLRLETGIRAHLQLAQRHGAALRFQEAVRRWESHPSGDGVTVETASGAWRAQHLILTPGAWAPQILSPLGIPFDIRRHVMCWFAPLSNPHFFDSNRLPIYIWDVDGRNCFYGFPATGPPGDGVKAAMHSGGQHSTAATVDRNVASTDVDELRQYLAPLMPYLNGPLVRASVCLYTLTRDEHFVVSTHPHHSQVSIAAGFSGHGFKFSPVIGEILADLATQASTRHNIQFLSPARFTIL